MSDSTCMGCGKSPYEVRVDLALRVLRLCFSCAETTHNVLANELLRVKKRKETP